MRPGARIEPFSLIVVVVLTIGVTSGAVVPGIAVDNTPDARIEILPVDNAHQSLIPAPLQNLSKALPSGAFVLINHTDRPITAIATVWTYTDLDGSFQQRRLNCDAYIFPPLTPIVNANDLSLIAPTGCTRQDLFPRLATGSLRESVSENAISSDSKATIHVYIDSVVFEDGGIWGPDKFHYSAEIQDRFLAAQNFVAEVTTAKDAGEEMSSLLARIHEHARQRRDRASMRRAYYAGLLLRSPNAEGTLRQLRAQTPPPQFHHLGDQPR